MHPRQSVDVGQVFGRLTVVSKVGSDNRGIKWECSCSCGNVVFVYSSALSKGETKSCKCLRKEITASSGFKNKTHGARVGRTNPPEYMAWIGMKNRCNNPNYYLYHHYGGRRIKVDAVWENDFEVFLTHVGPRPGSGYSLDRIDVNRNYEPGNVRWATANQQARNKQSTKLYTYQGKTQTLMDWVEEYEQPYDRVYMRMNKLGWSFEKALTCTSGQERLQANHPSEEES